LRNATSEAEFGADNSINWLKGCPAIRSELVLATDVVGEQNTFLRLIQPCEGWEPFDVGDMRIGPNHVRLSGKDKDSQWLGWSILRKKRGNMTAQQNG